MNAAVLLPHPKNQKLLEGKNMYDREDFLSKLPDSILHDILSLLPTKDAVRTSVLSTRWLDLWTYITNIDLDDTLLYSSKKIRGDPSLEASFVDFVERVILLSNASCLDKFRLSSNTRISFSRVYFWISSAIKHRVQELDLFLPLINHLVLPCCLFSSKSLTTLKLVTNCLFKIPSSSCLPSLKTLHLSSATFLDDQSTQIFFSCLPVLQELALEDCEWKNIRNLSINILTLKSLSIHFTPLFRFMEYLHDCEIKIYASNLRSLHCTSNLMFEFLLHDIHLLVDASIDLSNCGANKEQVAGRAIKLLSGIHCAKSLSISDYTLLTLCIAENLADRLPLFNNLTHLVLSSEFAYHNGGELAAILQRSPNLEYLDIAEGLDPDIPYDEKDYIPYDEKDWMLNSAPPCFKSSLRRFSISYFNGNEAEMYLIKFLLENATLLEKMTIFCVRDLLVDLEKLELIRNQVQMLPRSVASCVIELL